MGFFLIYLLTININSPMPPLLLYATEGAFDRILPIVILVFALSMISERFANFLKLWLPVLAFNLKQLISKIRRKESTYIFKERTDIAAYKSRSAFVFYNLDLKQSDQVYETLRRGQIILITILCGTMVATGLHEEIWNILNGQSLAGEYKEGEFEKWDDLGWFKCSLIVIGFGVLFSFGSKFWHDFLDLLLISKNIRRRVGAIEPKAFTSADQIAQFLVTSDPDLVEQAINENRILLESKAHPIKIIKAGYDVVNGVAQNCAQVYLEGEDPNTFPKFIFASGSRQPIPVKVIDGLGLIYPHVNVGETIGVVSIAGNISWGAVACKVKQTDMPDGIEYFILTCSHVVTQKQVEDPTPGTSIGVALDGAGVRALPFSVVNGYLQNNFDYCMISPPPGLVLPPRNGGKQLRGMRSVTQAEEGRLILNGYTRRPDGSLVETQSRLHKIKSVHPIQVQYDGRTLAFDNLISTSKLHSERPVTREGDSGTLFYDQEGMAIGIVIGADKKFTYLISVIDITNNLNCSIITT